MIALDVIVRGGRLVRASATWRNSARAPSRPPSRSRPDAPRDDVEISLLLTDDAGIRALNRDWRGKDKPTNVLSFPAPAQPGVPGPAPSRRHRARLRDPARGRPRSEGKTLAGPLAHLVVHGTLHLLGYDHELEARPKSWKLWR